MGRDSDMKRWVRNINILMIVVSCILIMLVVITGFNLYTSARSMQAWEILGSEASSLVENSTNMTAPAESPIFGINPYLINSTLILNYPNISLEPIFPDLFPLNYCSMRPTFCSSILITTANFTKDDIRPGDIIIFYPNLTDTSLRIAHRVFAISSDCVITKGDFNPTPDSGCIPYGNIQKKVIGIIYGGNDFNG
jgi:hypothetical protein